MSNAGTLSDLKKAKKDAQATLYSLEAELAHNVFKSQNKLTDDKFYNTYDSFTQDMHNFRAMQKTINELAEEDKNISGAIKDAKKIIATAKSQLPEIYANLGDALFAGYTVDYIDFFGETYTEVANLQQKINTAEAKENDSDSTQPFFARLLKHVKRGTAKGQIVLYEQKKKKLLEQGAKNALESGKAEKLFNDKELDSNSTTVFATYLEVKKNLAHYEEVSEKLVLEEESIKASLEKNGVTASPHRQIQQLDRQIKQKELEQNEFCATQGHQYACRYISPDGEIIVEFPEEVKIFLAGIQTQRLAIISLSRQIEILMLEEDIEKAKKHIESYNNEVVANNEKIEALQRKNEELASKTQTAHAEQAMFESKRDVLCAEEKSDTGKPKTSRSKGGKG
ncbi:MAG: hypothetical protein R3Y36_08915 [Spirochaetales bacterium]